MQLQHLTYWPLAHVLMALDTSWQALVKLPKKTDKYCSINCFGFEMAIKQQSPPHIMLHTGQPCVHACACTCEQPKISHRLLQPSQSRQSLSSGLRHSPSRRERTMSLHAARCPSTTQQRLFECTSPRHSRPNSQSNLACFCSSLASSPTCHVQQGHSPWSPHTGRLDR